MRRFALAARHRGVDAGLKEIGVTRDALCSALRSCLLDEPFHERVEGDPLDFWFALRLQGFLGALADRVVHHGHPDPHFVDTARQLLKVQFVHGARYRALLGRLDAALAPSGVEVLLLKGAQVATQFYPSPAWRHLSDLDLLVRPAHVPILEQALRACGLHGAGSSWSSSDGLQVDLHSRRVGFVEQDCGLTAELFWQEARPLPPFRQLRGLDVPLLRVYLAVHALKHCVCRLCWLLDLHMLGPAEPEACSSRPIWRRPLLALQTLTSELCGAGPGALQALPWWERQLLSRLPARSDSVLGQLILGGYLPATGQRLSFLLHRVQWVQSHGLGHQAGPLRTVTKLLQLGRALWSRSPSSLQPVGVDVPLDVKRQLLGLESSAKAATPS